MLRVTVIPLLVLSLLAVPGSFSVADPGAQVCPTAVVPLATGADVQLDGRLDEAAWQSAQLLGPFLNLDGRPARGETLAHVLCADGHLYIGFRCSLELARAPQLTDRQRDADVYLDESVEVFADAGATMRTYRHFILNLGNVQRDESGDIQSATPYEVSWNADWQSATSREEGQWTAELAIPLAELGLDPDRPGLVGLNLCRNDTTRGESTCWSPTLSGFHVPQRFGLVTFGGTSPALKLTVTDHGSQEAGTSVQTLRLESAGSWPSLQARAVTMTGKRRQERAVAVPELVAGMSAEVRVPYRLLSAQTTAVLVTVSVPGGPVVAASRAVYDLPTVLNEDFGYALAGGEKLGLWWAEATYKIHRDKPAPTTVTPAVTMTAAGREYECAQIVLRPPEDVEVEVRLGNFVGVQGRLEARHFELLHVDYVPVTTPTDSFGFPGDWPDPLPPVAGQIQCRAGVNQPIWLRAYVPAGTRPGLYRGAVTFRAGSDVCVVPVHLRVRAFSLTEETHTATAYGMSPDYSFLGITDPAQQERVYDLYLQNMARHRMAPYDPLRYYQPVIRMQGPGRTYQFGRFGIALDQTQESPWTFTWDGKPVAWQQTSMTHFEKVGVGYQGSGVSWPYVNAIQSVKEVSATPTMRVLEVVAAYTGSQPAQRSFRLVFRIYVPNGDNWLAMRLLRMEGTDPTEVEVREFYHLPRTAFTAKQVANGPDYAAWSGDGLGFGMIWLDGAVRTAGITVGAEALNVANPVEPFRIREGQTHEGWGPLAVYFVTDKTSADGLTEAVQAIKQRLDPRDPGSYQPAAPTKAEVQERQDFTFSHDFTKLDEGCRKYLDGYGFTAFNLACMPGSIGGYGRGTPEFARLHKLMYGPLIEHLREKGWLSKAYSYWYDEPDEAAYPTVIEGMKLLGENCPGLRRLLTEQPEPPLYGYVDLWVPVTAAFDPARCRQRQRAGDEVWWYVCCGPHAPYANDFIDHPALNPRLRAWQAEKYGVTGELYWHLNWRANKPDGTPKNPWTDAMSYTPDGGTWGNGDGFMLYPACREPSDTPVIAGPVDSIRWEMLREGLEDREYFWLLRQEVARLEGMSAGDGPAAAALDQARRALRTPDRLSRSLTDYTHDPQDLYAAREQVAAAIEACRRVTH